MITGASQADVALLMVPADGNFTAAIARGNHKAGEVMGQTRQHALLVNLLGVKQLIVGSNKMDCDVAKYSKERYDEVKGEAERMLLRVGWKKAFVASSVPFVPMSGWKGDVMVLKSDTTIGRVASFTAQVQILNHPGELKAGYTPIAFVRTGRSAVKITKIDWKMGKETGGQKLEDPASIKAGEMAQLVFEPQQPFVLDTFKNCEGLGRVAIMEGGTVVMLGKVIKVENKK